MSRGTVFDIREFTVHDGPGARVTVFLKGCPLRCVWCHNPEGLSPMPELMVKEAQCVHCGKCQRGCSHAACAGLMRCTRVCPLDLVEICGRVYEAEELAFTLRRICTPGGYGVTFSGGEPLLQPEFLQDALVMLRPVHRAVETSGYADADAFLGVAREVDLVMLDIKLADLSDHKVWTGVDNALILRNLDNLKRIGKPFIVRIPWIPGANDSVANLNATAALLDDCPGRIRVEILPYNPLAGAKYPFANRKFAFVPGTTGESLSPEEGAAHLNRRGLSAHVVR